ncbi:universal stress protein [Chloroflexota bacterium]
MYQKIMVTLDGSELAECVLPHVEAIAKGCLVKEVVFVRVLEIAQIMNYLMSTPSYDVKRHIESEGKAAAENYLRQLVDRVNYDGVNVHWEVMEGLVADSISDYATKNEVDLIIIATHGRSGISRWVLGSVADRILRSACVPVLMVRAPGCVGGI